MRALLFLFVLITGSITLSSQTANTVLWRITGNRLKAPSYLYGTMHIKDKRVFYTDDSLIKYINSCELFANELHPDSLNALLFKVMNQKDTSTDVFKNSFDSEEYELVNKKLQKDAGINLNQLKTRDYRYIKMLLNPTRKKSDDYPTFLDGYLLAIARRQGKTLVGLENIRSQEGAYNTITSGDTYKKEIIDISRGNKSDSYDDLIRLYQEGNISKIQQRISSFSFELEEGLLTNRNKFMARTIDSLIQGHTLFATCGAAHLAGKGGVIQLLKDMGYTLTPVLPARRSYLSMKDLPPNFNGWQPVSTPVLGVSYSLPGSPVSYYKNVFYSDMKMFPDMSTGCYYTVLPISMTVKDDDKQAIFDKYVNAVKDKAGAPSIRSQKRITYKGAEGFEMEYEAGAGNDVKLRLFTENNILYSFTVTYPANSDNKADIDYFFNSIAFFKPVKGETYSYYNARWGFRVELPRRPDEKKDISKSGGTRVEVLSLKSSDNIERIHYLLECTEAGEGHFYPQDSVLLHSLSRRFKGDAHVTFLKDSAFTMQGARCNETRVYYDDQSSLVNWSILRGFKYYNIMGIMSKTTQEQHIHDAIFHSLAFDPQTTAGFKPYSFPTDSLLAIDLPQAFKAAPSDEDDDATDTITQPIYRSYDPQTGITYYLQQVRESPYYYTVADSLYWKNMEDRLVSYDDTLLSSYPSAFKQVPAHEFIVKNKNKSVIRHFLTLNFGTYRYNIYTYLPQEMRDPNWDYPLSHVSYAGEFKSKIISDTAAFSRLVHDVMSSDSAVKMYGRDHFYNFKLTGAMMDQVQAIIASPAYQADTISEQHFDLKNKLIAKLAALKTEAVYEYVNNQLKDPKTPATYLSEYARVLAFYKTKKSYEALNGFFKAHAKTLGDYDMALYVAGDSLPLAALLYPSLLEGLVPDSADNFVIQNLTNTLLDSGLIPYEPLLPYEQRVINKSLEYTGQKTDPKSIFESYYIDNLAAILSHSPHQDLVNAHYRQLLDSRNTWCRYTGAYYLIKRGQPVDKAVLEKLAAIPYFRNKLYTDLKSMNRTDVMPEKYKVQEKLAEANLYAAAYDGDEAEISHAKFIKIMPAIDQGKTVLYYLYKVSFKDSKSKYLGVAGPYSTDGTLSNDGARTGVFYDKEYKKGQEADLYLRYTGVYEENE